MSETKKIMDSAYEAGAILLENGAEITRVEDTMRRIASHYGVTDSNFFVLSNGITATCENYAHTQFIPIKGTNLEKVVEVNQLSRDIAQKNLSIEELKSRLSAIKNLKQKPVIEQLFGSAVGSGAFCIIFGGGFMDCAIAFLAGFMLWAFMCFIAYKHLSRIVATVSGGFFGTMICLLATKLGIGTNLSNIIIGAIIPLIPGVPFTNGIRDLANEDYIAGSTRLLDALLSFFCIALGVALAFMLDAAIFGEMQHIGTLVSDKITSNFAIQTIAAFFGTAAFAILFGVPRKYYADCGISGALGWILYIILRKYTQMGVVEMVFLATSLVTLSALAFSILRKCPITVFLICGIFPLVPGEGIFRTSYNIVSNHLHEALQTGFVALKVTVAIALGILFVTEIKNKILKSKQ